MERIPWWRPDATGELERQRVLEVLASNYLNEGDVTTRFEHAIARRVGARHAVATTSGTAAISLALAALGVGPGDEVLVPDVTFIATANAAKLLGATPVLVDVDERTLGMDPRALDAAITPRAKAVVPVHVSGRGADMTAILARGIPVVEDAAEALASRQGGRALGTIGRMGCFSFSPNKTITTGQGGMVVTDDDALHARLRELKDQGRPVRGTGGDDLHPSVGFNFKLTNLQAAVGLAQLERLEARLERLKTIQRRYEAGLRGIEGIRLVGFSEEEQPQWVDALVERRDALAAGLAARGIDCRRFWFPLHTQAPYRRPDAAFPVATRASPRALWLPSSFDMTDAQQDRVVAAIREILAGGS
jgi:perosamine synthetase